MKKFFSAFMITLMVGLSVTLSNTMMAKEHYTNRMTQPPGGVLPPPPVGK
jgi:hypothetical protein